MFPLQYFSSGVFSDIPFTKFVFYRVENNCLPATFAIHRALKTELNVDNRIGATFGKVYCGIVGGVRRHEFACMGAPVSRPLSHSPNILSFPKKLLFSR